MKRFAIKLHDQIHKTASWLYVHSSGGFYRDVKDLESASWFYEESEAEIWRDKIFRNKRYEFHYPEIVSFDDDIFKKEVR